MTQRGVLVISVEPKSPAYQHGIRAGDTIVEINDEPVLDQLSYQFLMTQRDKTRLLLLHKNQTYTSIVIENGGNGIGIDLAQDKLKVCKQNCIFCFVRQMPKGFRESLYLKDEDVRLSFLYGHFTTLSSSNNAELDRIVRERLSPINVSVHATDPIVRVKLVGNPNEGEILKKIDHLLLGGVDVHTQVVLVPDINDGEIWEKTVSDLWERRAFQTSGPMANQGGILSLSCIPVGLTSHREGLPNIKDVTLQFASNWIKRWVPQATYYAQKNDGEPWLLLADEWFTRAEIEVPKRSFYSHSWMQIENGVGMIRKFIEHSKNFINKPKANAFCGRRVLILTGTSFAPTLSQIVSKLNKKTNSYLRVVATNNHTFGNGVTVAGLLCSQDLAHAARIDKKENGNSSKWVDAIVVPSASLRIKPGPTDQYTTSQHNVRITPEVQFLDDVTISMLEQELGVPIVPSGNNLSQMLDNLMARDRCKS
jgi:putative radical SAM enzyme (TIGR03279 family)